MSQQANAEALARDEGSLGWRDEGGEREQWAESLGCRTDETPSTLLAGYGYGG